MTQLVFTNETLVSDAGVDSMMQYFDSTDKGTALWFAIFDLAGGAVNDVATDATSFVHRDALFYLQSYAIDIGGKVSKTTKAFLDGLNSVITESTPGVLRTGAYPGYVDPALTNGQQSYWGSNLDRLQRIKTQFDSNDIFHNPQSVQSSR
jgi:hypothetical protein